MFRTARAPLAGLAILAALALPAFASSSAKVTARDSGGTNFRFSKKTLTVTHGRVTIRMHNAAGNAYKHGIAVEGHGVDKDGKVVKPGKTSVLTLRLKKGTYEFYCPVKGHKAAGMEGKLVVK